MQQKSIESRTALEAAKRSSARWVPTLRYEPGKLTVVLALQGDIPKVLPCKLYARWRQSALRVSPTKREESYTVTSLLQGRVLVIAGSDVRGELFGAGWLLRHLGEASGTLPRTGPIFSAPDKPVRGYQIGYRMKNNTYDAWTLDQFEQQMWDLAMFGMNTIQVISPDSDDDATSPLFHAPVEEVVVGLSKLSQKYGLRYDLYYPEMAKDYSDPKATEVELKRFEGLVARLPLVNSLHVPGGDPGHTPPEVLFPLVEKEAAILRHYHPEATVWVSAQGFDAQRFTRFYQLLEEHPRWLTGVFFGPQSREGLPEQRARIPVRYPLEFYPDIAHTMHAQFPVPQWDPIFALTEGREPICPRPEAFRTVYLQFAQMNSGFILYSEGVNDDVNKFVWAMLGWNGATSTTSTETILEEYARYAFGVGTKAPFYAAAIEDLERNWSRQLLAPDSPIANTHEVFGKLPAPPLAGWRWDSLLYREAYDRYLQIKRGRELLSQNAALRALVTKKSAHERMTEAEDALATSSAGPEETALHQRIDSLAGTLYQEVGLQLSVTRYGASNWERGANLDRLDTSLNDRTWLEAEMKKAAQLPSEVTQVGHLEQIAHWQRAPAGGFYDDLGDPSNEPHLVRGEPWSEDPEMYHAAIDGIADQTLENGWRLSWLSYAETLYETPLTLEYTGLTSTKAYSVRITLAGEEYALPMEVLANNVLVRALLPRTSNPEQIDFLLPVDVTNNGKLKLQWLRRPGAGGGGRGGQVAEVWVYPNEGGLVRTSVLAGQLRRCVQDDLLPARR